MAPKNVTNQEVHGGIITMHANFIVAQQEAIKVHIKVARK
jgi:hypothetical protein